MSNVCFAYLFFVFGAHALKFQNQETPIPLKTFDKLGDKVYISHDGIDMMSLNDGSCKTEWNSILPVAISEGKHCKRLTGSLIKSTGENCTLCVHSLKDAKPWIEGYDKDFVKELLEMPKDKRVVVDVGANVGQFSGELMAKGVKLYWFEPGAYTNQILEANVIANSKVNGDDWRPVVHVKAGASDKEETLYYKNRKSDKGNAWFWPPGTIPDDPEALPLKTVRLQDHVDEEVYLFKMDVQGFEQHVMEGSVCLFCRHKVHNIRTEFSPRMMKENGNSDPVKFLEMLQELGFDGIGDVKETVNNVKNQIDINLKQNRAPSKQICQMHGCERKWGS